MIVARGVSFTYPGGTKPALLDMELTIRPREYLAIIGPNASGKSTLARLLNGLLQPQQGQVLVGDLDTRDEASIVAIRQRVGMVFQDPDNQLVAGTVEDDIAFGLENLGLPPDEIRRRVADTLQAMDLADLRDRPPHLLSGGQKQRLALAGVLAMEPCYLILDEATAMLDPVAREEILKKVQQLRKEKGLAIIHITHSMEEALQAERLIMLKAGRLFFNGRPIDLVREKKNLTSIGFKVPSILALAEELRQKGLDLSPDIMTAKELAQALWKLASET